MPIEDFKNDPIGLLKEWISGTNPPFNEPVLFLSTIDGRRLVVQIPSTVAADIGRELIQLGTRHSKLN